VSSGGLFPSNTYVLHVLCFWGVKKSLSLALLFSQDANPFPKILKYNISHEGIRKNIFCFSRSIQIVLKRKWPDDVSIQKQELFINPASCIKFLRKAISSIEPQILI
jgi:hypothetical protein